MNNKGFTLAELIATIVILAIVVGISTYSITSIIKSSKEKNYELLISNIKDAAEAYYQECKYASSDLIDCTDYKVKLSELVNYGYLKANNDKANEESGLINPRDNKSIDDCEIEFSYSGKIIITAITTTGSCPQEY